MIKQFEINNYVKKQLNAYLTEHNIGLKQAMDSEEQNYQIAEILYRGFPTMVQKIYSFNKFKTFLWEKREVLAVHIQGRLDALEKPKVSKKRS